MIDRAFWIQCALMGQHSMCDTLLTLFRKLYAVMHTGKIHYETRILTGKMNFDNS